MITTTSTPTPALSLRRPYPLSRSLAMIALGACALSGAHAHADPAEMLYAASAHAGSPYSDVPGLPGSQFVNFGRGFRSSGAKWIFIPNISNATGATDQLIFAGEARIGAIAAQEGVTVVDEQGTLLNLSQLALPRINADGNWSMAFNPAASTTTGLVVKRVNGVFSTVARTGGPAPVLGGSSTFGNVFAWASITDNNAVSFQANNLADADNPFGTIGNFLDDGNQLLAQINETVPGNQLGGLSNQLTALVTSTSIPPLAVSPDGSVRMYLGDMAAAPAGQTRILVRNGSAVLQTGSVVGSDTVTAIDEFWLEVNGDWFARCTLTPIGGGTASSAIIRNGTVVARIGQPIFPGAGENWTVIIDYKGNNKGQWVITGTTNAADGFANNIAVLNSTRVISRAGDPVALDFDGVFNDNLFIHSFRDRCFLSDDGHFYVGTRMKNSPTTTSSMTANASLIRIRYENIRCSAADIANDQGTPLPGPISVPNNAVNEGDFNAFFAADGFFAQSALGAAGIGRFTDIADDQGTALPPFGTPAGANNGVNEGDYNCFFNTFFIPCV